MKITADEYLVLRGWTVECDVWLDPLTRSWRERAAAVELQCVRDEQADTFRRSYIARRVLEQCEAANQAMAEAAAAGAPPAEVAELGKRLALGKE